MEMDHKVKIAIQDIINKQGLDSPLVGFEESLSIACMKLEQFPARTTLDLHPSNHPSKFGSEIAESFLGVLIEQGELLQFFKCVQGFKTSQLAMEIYSGLNRNQYISVLYSARSLVETAAFLCYQVKQLSPLFEQVRKVRPSSIRRMDLLRKSGEHLLQ